MSRYFPKSACTVVYEFYYLLLMLAMLVAIFCFKI